ncbi:PREDICTED: ribonuclease UK114 [Tinamus guttatus]|uniref:ribonuclease UK114 n=1 Tax=Tinamus guttatus TaxID=94827 RepID=UPI00052EB536|nr:PREDICTED: ribonuclease UK114 [Tinamus guttatus]
MVNKKQKTTRRERGGAQAGAPRAPRARPYLAARSQAVLVDRTVYIAGQIGIEPSSGQLVSGGVKEEAKQALKNMGEILKAAGCDYCNVVKTTVLMADMKDFNDINDIYRQFFTKNFPARAAYQVAALPKLRDSECSSPDCPAAFTGSRMVLAQGLVSSLNPQFTKDTSGQG